VLLDFGAPGKVRLPAGQEHGRTIPLADIPGWITFNVIAPAEAPLPLRPFRVTRFHFACHLGRGVMAGIYFVLHELEV
jgi:hypothetical protein